ncbi:LysR family transcriptional regulator [Marinomonas primoryensis]|jgi:LysR family transcriptional activator of nhaA|uniref:LysR family transcriptional regulator n=1 Tax=Marinomonas primoryensis TaxID=178399 RepID=UPI00370448B5
MSRLNYHHLYYFWRVAKSPSLTEAADALHISQSALSAQIKQLEQSLSVSLFVRQGRKLVLTDMGRRVLAYAQDIFNTGEELEIFLHKDNRTQIQHITLGVQSNLSRNFIESFIAPLLKNENVSFSLSSRGMTDLLNGLVNHELDLVLTNRAILTESREATWQNQLVARQAVAIIGPYGERPAGTFPDGYQDKKWVVPGKNTDIRSAFESFCATHQYQPDIKAEVDDMAMLRLLARDSGYLSVLPPVVVKDEIQSNVLQDYERIPQAFESFYAITVPRKFAAQAVLDLIKTAMNQYGLEE